MGEGERGASFVGSEARGEGGAERQPLECHSVLPAQGDEDVEGDAREERDVLERPVAVKVRGHAC